MSEQPTEKQKNFLTQRKVPIPATKAEATAVIGKIINPVGETTQTMITEQHMSSEKSAPTQLKSDIQDCEELYRIENNVKAFFANNNEPLVNEKIGLYVKLIWMPMLIAVLFTIVKTL